MATEVQRSERTCLRCDRSFSSAFSCNTLNFSTRSRRCSAIFCCSISSLTAPPVPAVGVAVLGKVVVVAAVVAAELPPPADANFFSSSLARVRSRVVSACIDSICAFMA